MNTPGRPPVWTRAKIIQTFLDYYHVHNQTWPTITQLYLKELPTFPTIKRVCGSFESVIAAAKEQLLPPSPSPDDVLRMICAYRDRHHQWPLLDAFGEDDTLPSKAVVARLHGSCREALFAAHVYKTTRHSVIEEIQEEPSNHAQVVDTEEPPATRDKETLPEKPSEVPLVPSHPVQPMPDKLIRQLKEELRRLSPVIAMLQDQFRDIQGQLRVVTCRQETIESYLRLLEQSYQSEESPHDQS